MLLTQHNQLARECKQPKTLNNAQRNSSHLFFLNRTGKQPIGFSTRFNPTGTLLALSFRLGLGGLEQLQQPFLKKLRTAFSELVQMPDGTSAISTENL